MMLAEESPGAWMPSETVAAVRWESSFPQRQRSRRSALGALGAAVLLAALAPFVFAELLIVAGALLGAAVALWEPRRPRRDRAEARPAAVEEPPATGRRQRPEAPESSPIRPPRRAAAEVSEVRAAAPAAVRGPDAPAIGALAVGRPGPRHGSPGTVLVVDDHESMLVLVNAFLSDAGYRVLEAPSGPRALEICDRLGGETDLLLTDVRMPEMSGPELHARTSERHPGIKTLFMTGFASEWAEEEGVPAGAELIEKGFTPQDLQLRVKAILNGGG